MKLISLPIEATTTCDEYDITFKSDFNNLQMKVACVYYRNEKWLFVQCPFGKQQRVLMKPNYNL